MGLFFAAGSANHQNHLIEFSATHPYIGKDAEGDDAVFGRSIIAGLWTTDTSGSLTVAIAKATFDANSNMLKVETNGLADSATKTLRQLSGGHLDADRARTFGQGIAESAQWTLDNAPTAQGSGAKLGSTFKVVHEGTAHQNIGGSPLQSDGPDDWRSLCYALGRITSGGSLPEALQDLDGRRSRGKSKRFYASVVDAVVAATYHRFAILNKPNAAQVRTAGDLLRGSGTVPLANKSKEGFEVEVLPYLSPTGALLSLRHLASDARIRVHDWPPAAGDFTDQPHQDIGNASLTVAATLGLGLQAIADFDSHDNAQFVGYHAWSTYARSGVPDTIIRAEKYAAGIRVSIRYVGTNDQPTVAAVAAKVTLNAASASYTVDILGIDVEKLPSIGTFVGASTGAFDANAMNLLGCVYSEVNAVVTNHDGANPDAGLLAAWKPCLASVVLELSAPELQTKASRCGAVAYGFKRLVDHVPLEAALSGIPDGYQDEVRSIYQTYRATHDPAAGARIVLNLGI